VLPSFLVLHIVFWNIIHADTMPLCFFKKGSVIFVLYIFEPDGLSNFVCSCVSGHYPLPCFYLKCSILETGFCRRLQVEPTQLGPIDRASPNLRIPVPTQDRIYREVLTFVDWLTAVHFTATGAPPAVRCIRILPVNQYARWPITFGTKGSY
jgi:hypothetical protein